MSESAWAYVIKNCTPDGSIGILARDLNQALSEIDISDRESYQLLAWKAAVVHQERKARSGAEERVLGPIFRLRGGMVLTCYDQDEKWVVRDPRPHLPSIRENDF